MIRSLRITSRKALNLWSVGILVMLSITTQRVIGELGPAASLKESAQSADVVVIARATSSLVSLSPVTMTVSLSIIDTIKGSDIPKDVSMTFAPRGYGSNWGPLKTSTRLVFLQRREGSLSVSTSSYVSLPAVESPLPDGSDPLGAVIFEEKEVLASSQVSESEKREAINALGTSNDDRATAALHQALLDSSRNIQFEAMSRLALRGDVDSLSSAVETLMAPPRTSPSSRCKTFEWEFEMEHGQRKWFQS